MRVTTTHHPMLFLNREATKAICHLCHAWLQCRSICVLKLSQHASPNTLTPADTNLFQVWSITSLHFIILLKQCYRQYCAHILSKSEDVLLEK